jgi:hypothetical protein
VSYDVYLSATVDLGGPEPLNFQLLDWNYTSNCGPMWRAAGADLAEYHGKPASECIPSLRAAVAAMEADPAKYKAMNPENGWGSYDSLLPALREMLAAFESAPVAIVGVSR